MPKTKAYDCKQVDRNTWAIVEKWRTQKGFTFEDVAQKWGCSVSTVCNRRNNPDGITLREIRRMNLTDADLLELLKGGNL